MIMSWQYNKDAEISQGKRTYSQWIRLYELLGVQSCKDLREKVFFLWIKQNTLDFLQGLLYFS